ncbi:MAG TPA: type II secretion system protein [Opitutales bacterium]|nr:type II secretion system protein [Opitutales bacterium]
MSRTPPIRPAHRPGQANLSLAQRARSAFTLVEMLVVVALIGLLAAIIGISMKGGSQGLSLATAQRGVLSMVRAGLAAARIHNTRARLIIFADLQNWKQGDDATAQAIDAKVLHYYGVVYAMSDDPNLKPDPITNTKPYRTWIAFNDGASLPDGIYFVPAKPSGFCTDLPDIATNGQNAITTDFTYTTPTSIDNHQGTTTGLMQLYFPLNNWTEEGQGDWWYFIEFPPDGFYFNSNHNDNIIIGAGTPTSVSSISFLGTGEHPNLMFSGVQLRQIGGAAPVRSALDFSPTK